MFTFTVYPNPAADFIYLFQQGDYAIYTLQGGMVLKAEKTYVIIISLLSKRDLSHREFARQ